MTSDTRPRSLIAQGSVMSFTSGAGSTLSIGAYDIGGGQAQLDLQVSGGEAAVELLEVGGEPHEIGGWTVELVEADGPDGLVIVTDPGGVVHP